MLSVLIIGKGSGSGGREPGILVKLALDKQRDQVRIMTCAGSVVMACVCWQENNLEATTERWQKNASVLLKELTKQA